MCIYMYRYEAENQYSDVKCDEEQNDGKIDQWNGISSILGFCVGW